MPTFDPKAELRPTVAECYLSTEKFCTTFLPRCFTRPYSPTLHGPIFQVLDTPPSPRVLIVAPRGIGKSSIISFAHVIKKILYGDCKHVMIISDSQTRASELCNNIRLELEHNNLITRAFGPQEGPEWGKEGFVTKNGIKVVPRGAGTQLRGALYDHTRPDLIVVDDLETPEGVRSEEQRKKLMTWFLTDLLNLVDKGSTTWQIFVVGSLLHEDSLLCNLLRLPQWHSIVLDICDDNYNSNYPELMSNAKIKEEVEMHRLLNKLDAFYREYRSKVIASETALFNSSLFKIYDESTERLWSNKNLETAILIDPARTSKDSSDLTAIVTVSFDRVTHRIFVRDVDAGHWHPAQIIDRAILKAIEYSCNLIAVEVTGLNEHISYPFRSAIIQRGFPIKLHELKAKGKKEDRITALAPFYRRGMVYHNPASCGPLEAQLLSFPYSQHDDIMDAFAYFVTLLDTEQKYFIPPEQNDDPDLKDYLDDPAWVEQVALGAGWRAI